MFRAAFFLRESCCQHITGFVNKVIALMPHLIAFIVLHFYMPIHSSRDNFFFTVPSDQIIHTC